MPTASPPTRDAAIEVSVFWFKYRKEIAAVLIVALLGFASYAGYWFYSERRDAAAASVLANAKSPPDYEQVIARYSRTPAGASAYLLLAEAQRKEKKFVEANTTLQTFIGKHSEHELVSTAHMAIATNLESMGKTDEALLKYQQVAATYPKRYVAPFALLAQVEPLKAKGQKDEARRVCENIMTNYRESIVAGEANRQLRSVKPSGPAEPGVKSTVGPAPPAMLARPPVPVPAKAPSVAPTPGTAKPK